MAAGVSPSKDFVPPAPPNRGVIIDELVLCILALLHGILDFFGLNPKIGNLLHVFQFVVFFELFGLLDYILLVLEMLFSAVPAE